MTTQPGFDDAQPDGDQPRPDAQHWQNAPSGQPGEDAQPWDPAYPHPYPDPAQRGAAFGPYPYGPPTAGYSAQPGYPAGYPAQPGYPGAYPAAAPAVARRSPLRRRLVAASIGAVAAATVVGVAVATSETNLVNGTALSAAGSNGSGSTGSGSTGSGSSGSGSSGSGSNTFPFPSGGTGNGGTGNGSTGNGGTGNGSTGNGGTGNGGTGNGSTGTTASATQQVGVVDIVTTLGYQMAAAAGTGMVLTSNGEVLTNNHVIDGATSIKVTVVSTGKSYVAKVVGTAPTKDIAVLQLQNASGLKTANTGDSSAVAVGDSVTGVGNAGGVGGTPSAAAGKVTALGRSITASDETGSSSETLHGVIVTDAPIQAGDSGGPLYNSKDEIIGIDTAASTSGSSEGFAIPIDSALSIAAQIEKGIETSAIHIGYPGFMGIRLSELVTAPTIASVVQNGPADKAGLGAGDVITKVGGASVSTAPQLQKAVSSYSPNSKVSVTYTDPSTGSHTVTVTLTTGPAD